MAPLLAALAKWGMTSIAGAVAAKGKELVQGKLGIDLDDALGTEEGRIKLRELEMQHEAELQELAIQRAEQDLRREQMAYQDAADARSREVKIATSADAPPLVKHITPVLAASIVMLTLLMFGLVLFDSGHLAPERKDLVVYILGVLSGALTQVISYYFGSSRGSAAKDETIRALGGKS